MLYTQKHVAQFNRIPVRTIYKNYTDAFFFLSYVTTVVAIRFLKDKVEHQFHDKYSVWS